MVSLAIGINILYLAILVCLCLYGVHRFHLVRVFRKHRGEWPAPARQFPVLPRVTVQLPIYNEKYVVQRLIDAVCALDYPKDRLEIQVLDDSTDDTSALLSQLIFHYHRRGYNIRYLHRIDRRGYKAGALKAGLERAAGEFIAVFDADFVPPPDFLRKSIHHFTDAKVGMVQHRWDYLNRDYSWLTRIQSIFLDGHFVIEHTARHRAGMFFNFNGTSGIWRRKAIVTAGGWTADTLTEDLDLSYRAQMNGWRFVYLLESATPGEIPVDMNAFKSQQHRWAKGSIQTARKVLPLLWRRDYPLRVKIEGTVHLTSNVLYVLNVFLALLFLPMLMTRVYYEWHESFAVDIALFLLGVFSIGRFYYHSQRGRGRGLWQSVAELPLLLTVGCGISLNNARAVAEAVFGKTSGFVRTPKYGELSAGERWWDRDYRRRAGNWAVAEVALGGYLTLTVIYALWHELWWPLPFLLLYQIGFLLIGVGSVLQSTRKGGQVELATE